jgi:ribosomal protein L11 methyltransferase
MKGELYAWRKLSTPDFEEHWLQQLSAYSERLAITSLAGRPRTRVEVFALSRAEAEEVERSFGGTIVKQPRNASIVETRRKPISIRGRLSVVSSEAERSDAPANTPTLVIPAGMAFGTGEHATTLNCLRFLVDFAVQRKDVKWTALDLGCGSGILALGARLLGAQRVLAADFDPECVRVTRENCQINSLRGVAIRRLDVLQWEPDARYDLVCANLYSTILVQIARKLAECIALGGTLIFSGVMRDQEREVTGAFRKAGLRVMQTKAQGKWIAGMAALKT